MKTISDDIDFLKFVGKQESQFVARASEWTQQVIDRVHGVVSSSGDLLPWSKTHSCVQLRPGELSIWAGVNGHGKSQLLNQVCAWGLNKRWLIASLEMKPESTMYRMLRQVSGCRNPTDEYIVDFMSFTDDRLWIYDQTDTVQAERIIGMVHYAAQELGIQHVIIDSMMKCGIGATDDYSGQKAFVDRLCWAAKANNIHIHLIHHMRKGSKEGDIPDKFDIRGASEITDLADNVFIVHRNKRKEEKIIHGDTADEAEPDCSLKVAKQRNGEWEGQFRLWFNGESMQYTATQDNRAIPYRLMEEDTT